MPEVVTPTTYQHRILLVPESCDLGLFGGRGRGATYAMAFLQLRAVEQYGAKHRGLYTRQSFPGMEQVELELLALFQGVYGPKRVKYNGQKHRFVFSNGAIVQLDQVENARDFLKHQGKSYTLLTVDECGQYAQPEPLDLLRSSLRSTDDVPCRVAMAANPGDVGMAWINERYIAGREPWIPFTPEKHKRPFVFCPGTLADNPHLGRDYMDRLEEATQHDDALRKAWIHGDWSVARGNFFAQVWDSDRNLIDPWLELPESHNRYGYLSIPGTNKVRPIRPTRWDYYVSGDHGSSAPAVFFLVARSPGAEGPDGKFYPRGSIILLDEVAHYKQEDLNSGLGLTVPEIAGDVVRMCEAWGVRPEGALDDACFAKHGHELTLADEYRKAGLRVQPARKGDRVSGWALMRTMMADAGKPDKPGFYVSRNCEYFAKTVPYLGRDKRRPEDLDTKQADHAADAARYGLTWDAPVTVRRESLGF